MLETFFCGLCPYSSATKAHLGVHAYFTHDAKLVPWYKRNSNAEPTFTSEEFKNLVHSKCYFCALTDACQFSCLTNETFRKHLETHEDCSSYRCHLCFGSTDSLGLLLHHYRLDHVYYNVQCFFCDFGNDDDWIVMRHVMEEHSKEPFRVLLRNGDAHIVHHQLKLLVEEYLTMDPVEPSQTCAQFSPESFTEENATSSAEALHGFGLLTSEHSSLQTKQSSCTENCMSSLDPRAEEIVENHAATVKACVINQNAGTMSHSSECAQRLELQPGIEHLHPHSRQDGQDLTFKPSDAEPLHETQTSSSIAGGWHLVCSTKNCSMAFGNIFDYLNHLAECHPLESSFHCPKCDLVISYADLSVHLVEEHSGFVFCPYQDCVFGSRDQIGLDKHIMQAHLVYQEKSSEYSAGIVSEGRNKNSEDCAGVSRGHENSENCVSVASEELCTTSVSPQNYASTGSDSTSTVEMCNEEARTDKFSSEVSLEKNDDPALHTYACAMCSTLCSTLSAYLYHVDSGHSVPFICGHCFKPYKRSRCLLMHAGCLHLGLPFSILSLRDGKVTDIGLQVAPAWIEEAQQYLRTVKYSKMKAKGKTMLKNLKKAIAYISSACIEEIASHAELSQSIAMPHDSSEDQMLESGAERTSLPYEATVSPVGAMPSEQSVPSPLWYNLPSAENTCNVSTSSPPGKCLNQFEVGCQFKDNGISLISASSTKYQPSVDRRVKYRILRSVYIDASACKKVDGKVVVDSGMLLPMSSSSLIEGSDSSCSTASEKCHVCSKCFLTFSTFESLTNHIVKLHFENGIDDFASAVLSFGYNRSPQVSTFKCDIKQQNPAIQFKRNRSKGLVRAAENSPVFVCLHTSSAKVPYCQFSRAENLNPVVQLVRLPAIKMEPKE